MFTSAQAQHLGMRRNQISRLVDAQRVEPVCYGVYRFITSIDSSHTHVKAAWLSIFPDKSASERLAKQPFDAVLAGRTAASILGAGDFHASPYTSIVSRRKQTSRTDIRFLQCWLDEKDVIYAENLPVTSFERTTFDLLRLNEDPDLVDKFMQDAARKGHSFNLERLATLLSPVSARYGYDAGDGESFAKNLITRNTAKIQLSKASRSALDALAPFLDLQTLKRLSNDIDSFDFDKLAANDQPSEAQKTILKFLDSPLSNYSEDNSSDTLAND